MAFGLEEDSSLTGMTIVLPVPLLIDGATLVIGKDSIAGGIWEIPPGGFELNFFLPFTEGTLVLSKAGTGPMAAIVGSFSGDYGELPEREPYNPESNDDSDTVNFVTADSSLVINEVAAKGDPLDWFELYNGSDSVIDLTGYVVSDDLSDAAKRVASRQALRSPRASICNLSWTRTDGPASPWARTKNWEFGRPTAIWSDGLIGRRDSPATVKASSGYRTSAEASKRSATPLRARRMSRITDNKQHEEIRERNRYNHSDFSR